MKRCPECRRDYYDETLLYCLDDGSRLLDGPVSVDEPATAVFPSPESRRQRGETEQTQVYPSGRNDVQRKSRYGLILAAIFGALVLSALGYAAYRLIWSPPSTQVAPRANPAINTQRLTGDGKTREAAISPDGKFLAYQKADGSQRSLWMRQIQTNSNIQIVEPGDLDRFGGLSFSPDGNFVYFNAETKSADFPSVYRVPTLGGTPAKVFTNANDVRFSSDGRKASFLRYDFTLSESALIVADVDGLNERKIASKTGNQFFDGGGAWSPDGKLIAIRSGDDALSPNPTEAIALLPADGGAATELGDTRWSQIDDLVWHPSGDSLIIAASDGTQSDNQIWEISYPSAAARRLTNNLNGHYSVSITADGKSIVTGEIYSRSAVWVSPDLKPENAKPVMPSTGDTWGFGWTPDGRIVYVSDQTGDAEIWIMDADGANAKPLTNDRVFKTTPVVSSDGRYIVYARRAGGGELVRIGINGENPLVFNRSSGSDNPDISPDSKWIIYSAWTEGLQKVLRIPIEGGEPQTLTDYRATEPRYSRDGTRFACFMPNETTQQWTRLAIVSAEGGPPIKVFDAPPDTNITRGPIWTPDDRGITLVIAPGQLQNLWLQPVEGGKGKAMTNFQLPGVARREYSRDGKRIAMVRAEGIGNAIMITDFR